MQDGVCGNKVVDPDEDCDYFSVYPRSHCNAPGTVEQCRYVCNAQPNGDAYVCPPSMGCGTDGICRAPSGVFAAATQPTPGAFVDLLVGDVDGDHRADVVAVDPTNVTTTFFDGALASATTVFIPRGIQSRLYPRLRDLDGDGLADLLMGTSNGSLAYLGSSKRDFVVTSCPEFVLPFDPLDTRTIVLKGTGAGDTIFLTLAFGNVSAIAYLALSSSGAGVVPAIFAALPQPPSHLAGPVVVGHMIEDPSTSPCDELALAFRGDSTVEVYTACNSSLEYNVYVGNYTPRSVTLPQGAAVVRGPLLLDVNGDGHLDFLVGASRCPELRCNEIEVAYGVGDGTFHSDPSTLPTSSGDDKFSTYPLVTGPLPLAMGDLNGDRVPDYVTPTEVRVSDIQGGTVTFATAAMGHAGHWTEAVIADFNRDGIPDVAAGSSFAPDLDFFNGIGDGTFAPVVLQTAAVRNFAVGDYDGDLLADLAVTEIAAPGDPLGDSVSILFGNTAGAPSPPKSMGHSNFIHQMAAGKFTSNFNIVNGSSTLLTLAASGAAWTAYGSFAGSADRLLRSPLFMYTSTSTATLRGEYPRRYAFGHFTSARAALVDPPPTEVAAIGEQFYPPTSPTVYHPWLLPMDRRGVFSTAAAEQQYGDPLPGDLDWSKVAIGAVDLDGNGIDQLVALGPSTSDPTQGAVAIAHATLKSKLQLAFGNPTYIGARVEHKEDNVVRSQTGRLLVTDLDGDSRPDVIAIATVAGSTSVVVFWNDQGGQLGPMTTVASADGRPAVDFAVIDAGPPPGQDAKTPSGPSLAVLTDQGVSIVRFAQRVPAPTAALSVAEGRLIAAGDVDGDGVKDLVVANDAGFVVYRGQSVHP